jgi:hypothetical protein
LRVTFTGFALFNLALAFYGIGVIWAQELEISALGSCLIRQHTADYSRDLKAVTEL